MTMTAEQLAQLREVAERATCGRWELSFPCDSDSATIDREVEGFIPICVIEGAHPDGGYDEDFQSEQQANAEFIAAFNPAVALALLDELERKDVLIAEQDKRLVDYAAIATKSAGRVAELEKKTAFLKEKLAQLANFNPDWDMLEATTDSLREHMSELTAANKRIAELEARTVTVKLPDVERWRPIKDVRGQIAYRALVIKTLADAGINLTVEG